MLALERGLFMRLASFLILILLAPLVDSSRHLHKPIQSHKTRQHEPLKLTPKLSLQIKLHAFLLWASIGFLMPVGIIIIRMSNRVKCGKRLNVLFYSHVIVQMTAVLLATAGAVLSIVNFENFFNNTHQRAGLVVYVLIWIQPLIGFLRPHRGVKARSIWYFVHWLLGTGIPILGIINIYIGLHTYQERTSRSVRLWTVLFTAEVVIIAFIYLFQDRWDYMMKQGVSLGEEQVRPTDHLTSPSTSQKELASIS
ncbi:cytochrome b561 domain-containing protein At2g30890 [Elaeis guineensis]|uniref:Cytochrome b561 domain-containing protein At2g30890 n=1 Tax=Elaeis guineensis var. tenera TaxID=51953 RepID=A0A6I9R1B6_ELAGV|nr:cytochrome b561 domain-containing protein At2g30890 [Elaeis guineensis]